VVFSLVDEFSDVFVKGIVGKDSVLADKDKDCPQNNKESNLNNNI